MATQISEGELVAEVPYRPTACCREYRLVVVRKNLSKRDAQGRLFDDYRYFFYLSNDWSLSTEEVVFGSNRRCNQENLLAQLTQLRALHAPVDTLESNWAYMVMTGLAWNLKAWMALTVPVQPRWRTKHHHEREVVLRMEFKTFIGHFVQLPCQVIRSSRQRIIRLLSWNGHLPIFHRWLNVALE